MVVLGTDRRRQQNRPTTVMIVLAWPDEVGGNQKVGCRESSSEKQETQEGGRKKQVAGEALFLKPGESFLGGDSR
jgi:D-lyxose ketol-isomerase